MESAARTIRPVGKLEEIRRAQGLSQAELASRIGLSRAYISNVERGMEPPPRQREAIAQGLDVDPDALWP